MSLESNLAEIQDRINRACDVAGRNPAEVTVVAVTKTVGLDAVRMAYDLGLSQFGESRLQEALPKIEAMPSDATWHFIGRLQSNKARRAAEAFQVLQTLEKPGQLTEIAKSGRLVDGLIEVNIADEFQKTGLSEKTLDEFHQEVLNSPHVRFRGLMTIGPAIDDPERMRPYFRKLRELNRRIGGEWLSMGMSGDFDVAIQEGATHVRIGTALFGSRMP